MSSIVNCVFCEIIAGRLPARKIWENDEFIAFFPLKHINPGHLLLVPKIHEDYVFDLSTFTYAKLWEAAKFLAAPLQAVTQAKRIAVAVEGFSVPHVHVHLVPVNQGNELNPNREATLAQRDLDLLASRITEKIPKQR